MSCCTSTSASKPATQPAITTAQATIATALTQFTTIAATLSTANPQPSHASQSYASAKPTSPDCANGLQLGYDCNHKDNEAWHQTCNMQQ